MERIETTSIPTSEQTQGTEFNPAKARDSFKPITDWLAQRTPVERLCLWAGLRLHIADTQSNLQRNGLYDGLVGDELIVWAKNTVQGDPEAQVIASYLNGLRDGF